VLQFAPAVGERPVPVFGAWKQPAASAFGAWELGVVVDLDDLDELA